MRLHVDGLVGIRTDAELRDLFAKMGAVSRASISEPPVPGGKPGYGFVDMPDEGEARAAILRYNGLVLHGSPLVVLRINDRMRDPARPAAPPAPDTPEGDEAG